MKKYNFPCGCSFEIKQEFSDGRFPLCKFTLKDIRFDCPAAWKIFKDGLNAGLFQLESNLGKHYMKELAPENQEHLSALGAILRPGCLNHVDENGVNMTQKFCLRKNNREPVEPVHPNIAASLAKTYNILVYQEQFMNLAKELADFDPKEVDRLRKATGKKDQQEMSDVMKLFKERALKKGLVPENELDVLIDNIKATARYSFNKAHSVAYSGFRTYWTAYLKSHFPLQFFCSKLKGARFKVDTESSIQELISEAKLFNIDVVLPDVRDNRPYFFTDGKVIKYGLCDIKGIGESSFKKIKDVVKQIKFTTWFEFTTKQVLNKITDSSVTKLIESGALSFFGLTRNQMLTEWQFLTELKDGERENLSNFLNANPHIDSFTKLFQEAFKLKKEGGIANSTKRLKFMQDYSKILSSKEYHDDPVWITNAEENLLKYSITCQRIDACDVSNVNMTCKEFISGNVKDFMIFGVDIQNVIEKEIKNGNNKGKKFCNLKLTDGTCTIDAVAWPEIYMENQGLLTEKNSVIVQGTRNLKKKDNSLVIQKVWQAV